jgi:DUF1365 family protein
VHDSPALYRTRVTHLRRVPAYHYFEHLEYSWYVDVDRLTELPRWLRTLARLEPSDSMRRRVVTFLREQHGIDFAGGRITALIQPKGYALNPMTLYWCHDTDGVVRHTVVELHTSRTAGRIYLLPPGPQGISFVPKSFRMSPLDGADGHYLVRAPLPNGALDLTMSLHRDATTASVVTMRGERRRISVAEVLRLQTIAPLAAVMATLEFRVQSLIMRLKDRNDSYATDLVRQPVESPMP